MRWPTPRPPRLAGALAATALLLAGCGAFDYDADLGSQARTLAPSGASCAQGDDGVPLAVCEQQGEVDGVGFHVRAVAKGLGESLEVQTDLDDDLGGAVESHARLYQTFVLTSDTLADGTPVEILFDGHLAGFFREGPTGEVPGPSHVTWSVQIWTDGCTPAGCGPPSGATLLVDAAEDSGDTFGVLRAPEVLIPGLAVGDVFGVLAELHASSDSVPGLRVGADVNASLAFRDAAPDPDGPRVVAVRLAAP